MLFEINHKSFLVVTEAFFLPTISYQKNEKIRK